MAMGPPLSVLYGGERVKSGYEHGDTDCSWGGNGHLFCDGGIVSLLGSCCCEFFFLKCAGDMVIKSGSHQAHCVSKCLRPVPQEQSSHTTFISTTGLSHEVHTPVVKYTDTA